MENITINNAQLNNLDKNKPLVIALSGGVDSMVLFNMLKNAGFKLIVAHVNHHKRCESDIEEEYIKKLEDKDIVVEVLHYTHVSENFQADAHNKRYEFFYELYRKYNASAIITAHHYQDNLETIIMNIIRGSNIYGYAGIKETTYYKDALIIRPLINSYKKDLYQYAKENDITFFEDSSNQSDDYLRNRIRHHIIPLLEAENPSLNISVNNYSTQLFEAFNYIRGNSVDYFEKNEHKINVTTFNNLALIQKKDIINYVCNIYNIICSENKINDILEVIDSSRPNLIYSLNDEFLFVKAYETCYISKKAAKNNINVTINLNEEKIIDNVGKFSLLETNENHTNSINISLNEPMPLTIRTRLDGDKLIIGKGHKKLKDFLIDKKVPKEEREKILIVENANKEIIWVLNYYKKKCDDEKNYKLIFEVQ